MSTWTNEQGIWIEKHMEQLMRGVFIRPKVRRKQWNGEAPVFNEWDAEFMFGGKLEEDQYTSFI